MPLVFASAEDMEYFPLQLPWFKVIRLDQKRSATRNYRLDQFSVLLPCTPPPSSQRLPWLSAKSILSLVER